MARHVELLTDAGTLLILNIERVDRAEPADDPQKSHVWLMGAKRSILLRESWSSLRGLMGVVPRLSSPTPSMNKETSDGSVKSEDCREGATLAGH